MDLKKKAKTLRKPHDRSKISQSLDERRASSSDDSEDEELLVRTGKVPRKWYENYKHLGYDATANAVLKKTQESKLDEIIKRAEDPNWWRMVRDELNNKEIVLTDQQLDLLQRIRGSKFADAKIAQTDYSVEYDWDGRFPLQSGPIAKSKFLPSKWERIKVNKLVQAIKQGRIDPNRRRNPKPEENLFDLWENSNENEQNLAKNMPPPISAPKLALPGHAESYNPSEEYLLSKEEAREWLEKDPEDREPSVLPQKFEQLRKVPAYQQFVKERFERCLDLYLCPRVRRKKLSVDPEKLLPKLPKPAELRPFPTMQNVTFKGHESRVRSISVFHSGQFLASCDEAGMLIIWEIVTGRIVQSLKFEGINFCVDWSKDEKGGLLALCNENRLFLLNFPCIPASCYETNEMKLEEARESSKENSKSAVLPWNFFETASTEHKSGKRLEIELKSQVKFVSFHEKADYFVSVSPSASQQNDILFVHSLSKGASQRPFTKSKAGIEKAYFHANKPFLFVLTRKNTYIYNLQKQVLAKKLVSGAHWNSCLAIHGKGDNLLVGSYDRRICWFDLDLGNTPYKTLRYHEKAVRQAVFHRKYPLFASCSDDGNLNIFHATVYNDLMQNALIVPLKILQGHSVKDELGVLDIQWHPKQPWIFSAGADHKIIMWT